MPLDVSNRINKWKAYVAESVAGRPATYHYPADDAAIELSILAQDPKKFERERRVIAATVPKQWTVALDFGCGVGTNFIVYAGADEVAAGERLLVAIDPDPARVASAGRAARKIGSPEIVVRDSSYQWLHQAPGELELDHILCCQVLGHVSRKDVEGIIATLRARLAPDGTLAVLAPFVSGSMLEISQSLASHESADYFHLVDLTRSPADPKFRLPLEPDLFDKHVASPQNGFLPVRAFALPNILVPSSELHEGQTLAPLPWIQKTHPPTLEALFGNEYAMETCIYSVHMWDSATRYPLMGDVLVVIRELNTNVQGDT